MSAATIETETTDAKLSLGDVAKVDELRKLGWTIDTNVKPFKAFEKAGDLREVGPATTIKALHTQVMIAVGKGEGKTVVVGKSNLKKGEFLFDEMKPEPQKDVPELRQPILNYQDAKERRMELTKLEVESKKIVDRLMHDHQDELAVDPSSGVKSYQVDDIVIELIPGEDKLKSRRLGDEDGEKED